ncbi:hypothetical protein ASF44_10845 [Pseudorhodoferax sp. Leaf274]|nr:hypothetical protein ASF44_10845 [Pseudorhodoferax sp. Leaf274]
MVDGGVTSELFRSGAVAAQWLNTDGLQPRVLIAFVAGNSGAALWFQPTEAPVAWRRVSALEAVSVADGAGRPLHGLCTTLEVSSVSRLVVRQALVGSVRVLRDHQFDGRLPAHGVTPPRSTPTRVQWSRDRLDGAAGYLLSVEVLDGGSVTVGDDGGVALDAPAGAALRLRIGAWTGDTPERPLHAEELLLPTAAALPEACATLEFLSYHGKLLAGSWRFHTYFGRDTLMTLRLLLPVLQPQAMEAGLASVLRRLSWQGAVAHEEDVGEFPILLQLAAGAPPDAAPVYDYKMVDDDFMLLPVAAAYLLDTPEGRARADAFLAAPAADGVPFGACLARNLGWVLDKTAPFLASGDPLALVRLLPGEVVGDWRDSHDGLAGGVYPYSVNVALVPAALRAASALGRALLAPYLAPQMLARAGGAGADASRWEALAQPLFDVRVEPAQASRQVTVHAAESGLPASAQADALHALQGAAPVFSALALDAQGRPLPVMHSDFAFVLLLSDPSAALLERELQALLRPFPAGLMTDAGLLVANAAYANKVLRPLFAADRYHGAVVWSWQQAMAAAGLARQRARDDLPPSTQALLREGEATLWRAILAHREVANGELWSWRHDGERFVPQAYGPLSATADESNVAQLWSSVYLAVQPPAELAA